MYTWTQLSWLMRKIYINIRYPQTFIERIRRTIYAKSLTPNLVYPENKNRHICIVIVTYNALPHIKNCITSLRHARKQGCEIVIYDNNSAPETKEYLKSLMRERYIDALKLSDTNKYFVNGVNEGIKLASKHTTHYLLLNPDTEIKSQQWFPTMTKLAPDNGILAFGHVSYPHPRPDGWCFMVGKNTFNSLGGLSEEYQMDWGITDFTSRALKEKIQVHTVLNPSPLIIHHGQKSRQHLSISSQVFATLNAKQVIHLFRDTKQEYYKLAPQSSWATRMSHINANQK